jgi:hypothetical protein
MDPEKVPQKLVKSINYKILLLILGLVLGFQLYISSIPEEDADLAITAISIVNPAVAALASFWIAKKYRESEVFGKSYISLGIALAMVVVAEFTYLFYQFVLEIEPYPSIADVFFFALYPFLFYHLAKNIKFFKPKLDIVTKSLIVIIPISIVGIYSLTSYNEIGEANFDYYYGLIFVSGSSVVLSAGILGARIFRQGVLGVAWLLLAIGIVLTTVGDVWYYYLETYDQYTLNHPVNLFWWASYMVITYALYKHQDTF